MLQQQFIVAQARGESFIQKGVRGFKEKATATMSSLVVKGSSQELALLSATIPNFL